MMDADHGSSPRSSAAEPKARGLLGAGEPPRPRYRSGRFHPPGPPPIGMARTLATVIAMPLLLVLEIGLETARTLRSAFSLRSPDR